MAALDNHLEVANECLAAIGAGDITSFDEETELAEQVQKVYFPRLDAIFGVHFWSFAGRTFKLDGLAPIAENGYDTAAKVFVNGWRYGFAMPGGRLSAPRRVMIDPRRPDDPFRDYAIEENAIYTDRAPLWAAFTVRADPLAWSPAFRLAVITICAADLCVPITHDRALAADLIVKGMGTPEENGRGGQLGQAIAKDISGAPIASPLRHDPLSDARWW